MSAVRRRWLSILVMMSALALAPRAGAAPADADLVHLEYAGAAPCNDAVAFTARVDRQTPGIPWTRALEEAQRSYRVTIARGPADRGGYDGVLRGTTTEGAPLLREARGSSCQEVEIALAFVLAVELAPPPVTSGRLPSTNVPPGVTAQRTPSVERRAPSPVPRPPAKRWLSATVDLGGRSGLGTTLAPLVEVGALAQIAADEHHAWGQAHLKTTVGFAAGAPITRNRASITLSLWTMRVEGCFPRAALRRAVLVFPCASLEGGVLLARGDSAEGGRARPGTWLAPGVGGQVVWEVSRSVYLGAELGAFAPLVRDSFYFTRRDRAAFDVPALGVRLSFGATLLFL